MSRSPKFSKTYRPREHPPAIARALGARTALPVLAVLIPNHDLPGILGHSGSLYAPTFGSSHHDM